MSPRYGSRLMPVVVDEKARAHPDLAYASVSLTTNVSDGFKTITFFDIASATNHVATWIDHTLGRSCRFDTIAYMGPNDLRYVVVFLAAVKCGYKVLLPSLRNAPWMNASLFEQTGCSHLLYAQEVEAIVETLLQHRPGLPAHQIRALETLIHQDTPYYPYEKTYEEAKWDPILILHSSGSTGAPRPIQMNHNTFAVGDNDRNLPTIDGRVNQNWSLWDFPHKEHFFSPFPAFHLAGFSSMVMLPIYYSNATLTLGPPMRPPTGHLLSEIMDHFQLKSIFCPPIIAEQLLQEPGILEKCKSLKFLLYAGGPLSQAAGDALSRVTDVCQFYGQTETGAIQALVPKREDWASLEWHPKQEAIMEQSIDGTFELIMHRNPALESVRNLSCNFPNVQIWRTKDLFKPHPTKAGLWRFHGRADDIIILSNGEKFNPVPSETQIAAHSLISGALIIGQNYPQPSLILEPKGDFLDLKALIEQVWPTIEKANMEAPGHARVTRDMILVGSMDKPFVRSPKGTVIRKSTEAIYEVQIADLYSRSLSRNLQQIKLSPPHELSSTIQFVTEVVGFAFPGRAYSEEDDLFVLGLDSLQATEIISLLKAGITRGSRQDVSWITPKFIYEHPSIKALSRGIWNVIVPLHGPLPSDEFSPEKRKEKMEHMMRKYIDTVTKPEGRLPQGEQQPDIHVLLTGSTGSLGTQILVKLASEPTVAEISCLDRSPNARERFTRSLSTWPQSPILDPSRIFFYQADYSKLDFGLSATTISHLRKTTNLIIHNAWKVDFNHSLASFEAVHICGIQNLIDFSASSRLRPRVVFVSSISSVGNWHHAVNARCQSNMEKIAIPEEIAPTPLVAQPIGYAESKAIAEQILAAAAKSGGPKASIVRVGQITGPIGEMGGIWNEHEWFPLLLKTSKALGKIPDASLLDNIDWVPVDILASIMLDLLLSQNEQTLDVYHVVNPSSKSWAELFPSILTYIGNIEVVSMQEWINELEKVDTSDHGAITMHPAVKILDFFKEMRASRYIGAKDLKFSTTNAMRASSTLRQLGPVQAEWIVRWMKEWGL